MTAASRSVASYERAFFASMALLILASVLLGFARTFYLKAWFPEVQHLAAPEPIFALHGALFTLWFLLLAVQPVLISRGGCHWRKRMPGTNLPRGRQACSPGIDNTRPVAPVGNRPQAIAAGWSRTSLSRKLTPCPLQRNAQS